MKISKLSVILFIFLLAISLSPLYGTGVDNSDQTGNPGLETDQVTVPTVLGTDFVNASITSYNRNVTVLTTGLVTLEDDLTLEVLDEDTQIATLNYSIPTEFANGIQEAIFFTQTGDSLGIDAPNNSRTFTVFYGEEVTTYQIDIVGNGEPLNSTVGELFVQVQLSAIDLATVKPQGSGQRVLLPVPVVPMIPNLSFDDALIGVALQGTQDSYVRSEIPRVQNRLGSQMPRFTDVENVITYLNMSRDAFDYRQGMQEADLVEIVFDSRTPVSLDAQTEDLTAMVPTRLSDADRIVRFDPWGTVFVEETITVEHLGAPRNSTTDTFFNIHQVPSFIYTVSDDALITEIYDDLGSLTLGRNDDDGNPETTIAETDGKQTFRVDFRTAIYGGETYTFTVEYKFNASQIIAIDDDTDVYTMNTTLFSDFNVTAADVNVRYQFPAGTTFMDHTYETESRFVISKTTSQIDRSPISAFSHFELVFDMKNVSYVDNNGFQISFTYNGVGHFQNAATYLYLSIIILAFAYAVSNITYRPSKAIEIEKALIPVDEMDTFFNLFSEKTGAETRIAELRKKRRKGKLSKKDYDGQVKSIRRRLRDLNPQLEKAAKNLSDKGGRYENYVQKVMLASSRQSDLRRNAREAKKSYERGHIPKDIYQLRIREYNEELRKQETTINKTLTEMVEIIQKFIQ